MARARYARYNAAHREERNARSREYYAAHREELRAAKLAYHFANRDRAVGRSRLYSIEHREERRLYDLAHHEERRSTAHRRRALRRGSGEFHTAAEWREKCALLGNVCIYCGEPRSLTRDHNVPLSRGGSNAITNILPACLSCNKSKGRRTAGEFIALRRPA